MGLNGCMIGAGFFARHHIDAWRRIKGVQIVAVADHDGERAKAFAREFGIERWYTDAETMLDEIDCSFVDIVTRPAAHGALVRLAAERQKAIWCQKPFARTLTEAAELVELCERRGVRLMVNENWRWQPWYRAMQRALGAGQVGQVHHVQCVVRPGDGSGPNPYPAQPYFRTMKQFLIRETLIHFLDTFLFLCGPVHRVNCRTRRLNPAIEGEDFALITLQFQSGASGVIDANRYAGARSSETFCQMRVEGSKGSLELGLNGELYWIDMRGERRLLSYLRPKEGYRGDSCRSTHLHFIEGLLDEKPFETEGAAYLMTLQLVEACYKSADLGAPVVI